MNISYSGTQNVCFVPATVFHMSFDDDLTIANQVQATGISPNQSKFGPDVASQRVVADDGVARLDELVPAMQDAGFDGWYDVEIISGAGRFGCELPDSLWKLDPLDYAQRQVDGFLGCRRTPTSA